MLQCESQNYKGTVQYCKWQKQKKKRKKKPLVITMSTQVFPMFVFEQTFPLQSSSSFLLSSCQTSGHCPHSSSLVDCSAHNTLVVLLSVSEDCPRQGVRPAWLRGRSWSCGPSSRNTSVAPQSPQSFLPSSSCAFSLPCCLHFLIWPSKVAPQLVASHLLVCLHLTHQHYVVNPSPDAQTPRSLPPFYSRSCS